LWRPHYMLYSLSTLLYLLYVYFVCLRGEINFIHIMNSKANRIIDSCVLTSIVPLTWTARSPCSPLLSTTNLAILPSHTLTRPSPNATTAALDCIVCLTGLPAQFIQQLAASPSHAAGICSSACRDPTSWEAELVES